MRRLLTGARLFTGERIVDGHALLVEDGRILDLVQGETAGAEVVPLPAGSLIAPGFIDTQVNGGGGALFNDTPTVAAIRTIVAAHRRFGTTGLLPTFITDAADKMHAAASAAAEAMRAPASGVLGLHLEGPFLARERRGVHDAAFIRAPTPDDLAYLVELPNEFPGGKVLLSLAPETVSDAVIGALAEAGLLIAGAHSAASFARTTDAIHAGLSGFTHLFNAMPPLANREPGIAGAALASPEIWCGIIVDGIHVHPAMLRLALAAKPRGKLMLVTDAMTPLGTDARSFTLYGARIHRRDGRLVTDDGTLAGADLDMGQAVRNTIRLLGVEREEALRMASLYPAEFLGMADRRGRLAPGYLADLTLLDARDRVLGTWVAGEWQAA
ncbi:N-acetylglucosamine-6-phosphate deacetylase [Aliidongia dinghuensis]|uniref:N-acetylglucosamine-6-phosphate deacetylase n=1 Tax=Aliidongia dinghuensis TaxID=1867774 RepID=A0A8J2YX90_9PROT|nr:N-acetylglucosamine-6-phosphate deacetylase [Aliidongia dinghuensis]GGF27936.1 N-acetylglucosamine-6-phosphate deacetylase [Aliidongia dinghuensis]